MNNKFLKRWLCLGLSVFMLGSVCFAGCDKKTPPAGDDSSQSTTPPEEDNSQNTTNPPEEGDSQGTTNPPEGGSTQEQPEEGFTLNYRTDYTLTKLKSVAHNKNFTELADGVMLVKNTVKKQATVNEESVEQTCIVYSVEVDLTKAEIHAGTSDNKTYDFDINSQTATQVPYKQAVAWERATGGKVYASMNADFFGWTEAIGNYTCNALVKDGYILSTGHVDKGGYDYKNANHDVPASAPMLFGVNGKKAQLAPIISYKGDVTTAAVKETLVKAKLSYTLTIGSAKAAVVENAAPSASVLTFLNKGSVLVSGIATAVKVDVSKGYQNMSILEVTTASGGETLKAKPGEYAYLISTMDNTNGFKVLGKAAAGGKASLAVTSPDGKWNGYNTVLGCRQTLVLDGAVAPTVALENSNGAERPDIPRTCVGIKDNGKVVLFMVESLYYGKKAEEGDTHGLSLPELAEFVCYYGCKTAGNFDGGGSSQLITSTKGYTAAGSDAKVLVRSSDTGSSELESSRKVMTTIFVTSKVN